MKKSVASLALALMALASVSVATAAKETIHLRADYWMPYNGDGAIETGYMLDIAKTVFSAKGIEVVFEPTPWNRAIETCRSGQCDAIVGAFKSDAPDFVFPTESMGISRQAFFVRSGFKWKYDGLASLKEVTFAYIDGYSYTEEIDAYIATNPSKVYKAYGDNALQSIIKMLLLGRVDVFIEDVSVAAFVLADLRAADKVEVAGFVDEASEVYIAFSPAKAKSKEYARILSEGIVALRKSGDLKKILAKYGLKDWK
jgi:polar amino acid transport system substrate-binding protein